ncbi:MAG: hypothetical protein KBS91_04295, partial [Firmicutes bacterium]|nr:hypothetical protein [Candidatus Caballimonas caccae]
MEINRDSIILKNDIACFNDTVSNECKTEIDSNSVSKILGLYVKSVNSEGEILENSIKYKSNVIYSICYIDNEKNIKKSECFNEICGEIKGAVTKGYLHIDIKPEKVD